MVAPCAANEAMVSPSGIGVRPPSRRVMTSDWLTSGTVISTSMRAAVALKAEMPGTVSTSMPRRRHRSRCSAVAP